MDTLRSHRGAARGNHPHLTRWRRAGGGFPTAQLGREHYGNDIGKQAVEMSSERLVQAGASVKQCRRRAKARTAPSCSLDGSVDIAAVCLLKPARRPGLSAHCGVAPPRATPVLTSLSPPTPAPALVVRDNPPRHHRRHTVSSSARAAPHDPPHVRPCVASHRKGSTHVA